MDIVSHGFNIYHDFVINASITKIFNAISQPEHLNNWWTDRCTGTPELGAKYNFYFTEEYDWYGKVITCQPNLAFHVKMVKADEDWNPTSFGFNLEQIEEGVQVRFWHIDWPECNHHFRKSSFCWALLLNGLKNYLEKEIIVPFVERS